MRPTLKILFHVWGTNMFAVAFGVGYALLIPRSRISLEVATYTVYWAIAVTIGSWPFSLGVMYRILHPTRIALRQSEAGALDPKVRIRVLRRVFRTPMMITAGTFATWLLAAILYEPFMTRFGFDPPRWLVIQVGLGTVMVGYAAGILAYYRSERICREEIVERLMGGLSLTAVGPSWGMPVWARINMLVFSSIVVPMLVGMLLLLYEFASMVMVAYFLGVSMLLGVLQGYQMMLAVSGPIGHLDSQFDKVRHGDLSARAKVRSADTLGHLADGFNLMLDGLQEREFIKDTFGKYVTRQVAEEILGGSIQLGGERRVATVLFCDIRSFTTMSEQMEPEEVVGFLNEYFDVMVDAVVQHGGTLDKYIGDAIMATFGVPVSHDDHAHRAVLAALEMLRRIRKLNVKRKERGEVPIKVGIGIQTGPLIAGNIGSNQRMEYTVVGDTVNTSARIEQLCKKYKQPILIGEDTADALAGALALELVGKKVLRGRSQPTQIFRPAAWLLDATAPAEERS